MKALTVRQPYAWAIANGHKLVENRARRTGHRGPLAIHAGGSWHPSGGTDREIFAAVALLLTPQQADDLAAGGQLDPAYLPGTFATRAVIAIVDLVGCHLADEAGCCAPWGLTVAEGMGSVWHWELAAPRPLRRPIPARGQLQLWDIDDERIRRGY